MAVEHINSRNSSIVPEAALLPEGFRISPMLLDSEFLASGGVNSALRAREAGVIAVVGASRSSATIPLANIMLASKTPVVSYASTSADLSSQATFPLFARTIPTDAAAADSMARLMLVSFGWRRVGVLHADDVYGHSYYNSFRLSCSTVALEIGLPANGYEVSGAAISAFSAETSMEQLQGSGIQVYALALLGGSIPAFLRAAIKLNMTGFGYT
jgi:ABC-type branched-subunit amino acid transport system substrate-binding protein